MSKTVAVGCKLPHGLILENPMDTRITVTLKGLNQITVTGAPYAIREVDADFWALWSAANVDYPAVKNGAIFSASNPRDLDATYRDIGSERTGLEPMQTDGKDPRASGTKPAEAD